LPKGSEGNYNDACSDAWSIDPEQSDWEKVDFRGGERNEMDNGVQDAAGFRVVGFHGVLLRTGVGC